MLAGAHSHGGPVDGKPPASKAVALRSYDVADFPRLTGREEEWRFTPLGRLHGLHDSSAEPAAEALSEQTGTWAGGELPSGVRVEHVDTADPRVGSALVPFDRPSADAYGKAGQATVVSVAPNAVVDELVRIDLTGRDASGASYHHTVLDVGANAEVKILLDQSGNVALADNVEILVGDNASVTVVTRADWSGDSVQLQHQRAKLGRDSRLTHIAITLGGDLVRQYTSVEFTGRGGEVDAYGIYFADAGQHLEHRLFVDHSVPDCRSNVVYRGALQGADAHTVWVGDVLIQDEATGTDTYEINRNLVLTDGARADSVPNLEIETGEIVGAGHASATGRFDDEQLFYLQSRGIPADEARRLVVRGFFAEIIQKIGEPELVESITQTIDARLAKAGA
ncbi:Fe-S cluster assembly protein SufD [Cryptosporangium aurantiacum]|uniref:Iron-regulated ABC transporter permease protein SufD n=1 Tax=Cryptosporangium aurantiacum TaxID=134849 RepID=A0A1M7J6X8_9ACTN|nr:Iron-regulated ABC transporter permease protein SufD [Cryptosporangium aurantiacum]